MSILGPDAMHFGVVYVSGDVTKKEFCDQLYSEKVQMLFRRPHMESDVDC